MNWHIIEFTALFIAIGAFLGSITTLFILRRLLKNRVKSLNEMLNDTSTQRMTLHREYEKKLAFLKILSHRCSEPDDSTETNDLIPDKEDYLFYLSELNELLQNCKIGPPTSN